MSEHMNLIGKVPEIAIVLACIAIAITFLTHTGMNVYKELHRKKVPDVKNLMEPHACYYRADLEEKLKVISELDKRTAVILERLDEIRQSQKETNGVNEKNVEELFNRMRKLENKVSILEAVNNMTVVSDDTK